MRSSLDTSLERLAMDSVDILYYHRPDGVTPIAETVGAMHALVDEGKVRRLGVSNVTPEQLREIQKTDLARWGKVVKQSGAKVE